MKRQTCSTTLLLSTVFTCFLLVPFSQDAQGQHCPALADLRIEDTNLLSATVVPASEDLPEYCRVLGYVRPAINFEIRLPTAGWNGKFYMAGCGGFCGTIDTTAISMGLMRNYAVSTMDGGHWGETVFDAPRWAYQNRQAEIDFAYRAVHETARVTKTLINTFYGQAPNKSYFDGCSNGGRQAVMEALRYPNDFDGIISGAPDLHANSTKPIYNTWMVHMNKGSEGKNLITAAEAKIVGQAVYEACDHQDGIKDGLISDPRTCDFDPATLLCQEDQRSDCLSAEQVDALKAFYRGPRSSSGESLYGAGVPLGSEPYWSSWIELIPRVVEEYLRYMAFQEDPGESYSIHDFDFDRDPPRLEYLGKLYDADNPDLEAFSSEGGKLLMWHGWADMLVPPTKSIEYYETVKKHLGNQVKAQDFFRLFLIPGMDHCGINNGPGITMFGFDPLTALEQWVEQGEAPTHLLTTKRDTSGDVLWTRPVCPYPQRAVYDGEGDVNDASNFECLNPD